MEQLDIWFPNMGIYLRNIPKSFMVFQLEITFYGVLIGLGVLAGILLVTGWAKITGQNPDIYWDFSAYVIFFSIIGARIYYVIFAWEQYKNDWLSVFNIRQGGGAIYGSVIAAFITLFIYAGIKKTNALVMADTGVLGLLLGQIIGRFGNFTNREVFGEYTDNLFAMRLPIEMVRREDISDSIAAHMTEGINYIQVHPTFLYESLWNTGILIVLLLYWRHKKYQGEIALLYFAGYGLGRAWIEGIRTDQLFWPGTEIPVSQMLAVLMLLFSITADIGIRVYLKKNL